MTENKKDIKEEIKEEESIIDQIEEDVAEDMNNSGKKRLGTGLALKAVFTVILRLFSGLWKGLSTLFEFLFHHWKVSFPVFFILLPMIFIALYLTLEQTEFDTVDDTLEAKLSETDMKNEASKGVTISFSIRHQLERELGSFFGWSANDLLISPTAWLDNRANRESGVIFSTKLLTNFFSTKIAKFGKGEEEHKSLKLARDTYFVFQPNKFWFPSSESQYKKGIKLMEKYDQDLLAGNATYNLRTDDIFNLLTFIVSEDFLGEPLGRLSQSGDKLSYFEIDDHIYYAQGVILVVRDVIRSIVTLYPEILEKGGKENIDAALKDMDSICSFNPLVVMRGKHDSMFPDHRSKISRYLFRLTERLKDVAESINK